MSDAGVTSAQPGQPADPQVAEPGQPADPGPTDDGAVRILGRRSYEAGQLGEQQLAVDWLTQLRAWYADAEADQRILDANAMQLATADAAGHPDIRTVLAKGFDSSGVVFFTNYDSAKGHQLAENPVAAAVFAWLPLERQVRFRGPVRKVGPDETAQYFATRPRGAQLAAWASPQSSAIEGRSRLDELLAEVTERFEGTDVPPPPGWGGYRITVTEMEFWQGRQYRLHDRLRFRRSTEGQWLLERLAP